MSSEILDNPKSARVRKVASLARKKDRHNASSFLVEGPQAVSELLTHRPDEVEAVFVSIGGGSRLGDIDRLADAAQLPVVRVTEQVLAAMADTVQPQGVVAVASMARPSLAEALQGARLVAVLHEVRDPGNAGTVLRAADAAGADAVIFSGESIDPWHPKVVRSTTGSLFHLPVLTADSLEEAVAAVRVAGCAVFAADVGGEELGTDRSELLTVKGSEAGAGCETGAGTDAVSGTHTGVAWVFGNEARGLTDHDRAMADRVIRLPIYGAAESLNLATAASVLLYETAFAQRAGV